MKKNRITNRTKRYQVATFFLKCIGVTPFLLLAFTISAKPLGPEVAEYNGEKLQWEEGNHGYFVLFNSLLDDKKLCIEESVGSSYTLGIENIPQDAVVERAFLVWTGSVASADYDGVLDNEVSLKFIASENKYTVSKEVVVEEKKISSVVDFSFEKHLSPINKNKVHFTYRTDVTDFFKQIHSEGKKAGVSGAGLQLLGDYNVSNIECVADSVVSDWSIVLIYTSVDISPKEIYIYRGFEGYQNGEHVFPLRGFETSQNPIVFITLSSFLSSSEQSEDVSSDFTVRTDGEWLSRQSESDEMPFRNSGTFVIDTNKNDDYAAQFVCGTTEMEMQLSVNADILFTNFAIVAMDISRGYIGSPGIPNMFACTFSHTQDNWCEKDEEMWFAIRVMNIGYETNTNLTVTNPIDSSLMEYVSGSAAYATTFDEQWQVKESDWISIPDSDGFPLQDGYKLFDKLDPCFEKCDTHFAGDCFEGAIVRYKVKLRHPSNDTIINNIAEISSDEMLAPYKTNSGIPMRLTYDSNCEDSIDMTPCGGDGAEQESEDSDVLPDDDMMPVKDNSACSVVLIM